MSRLNRTWSAREIIPSKSNSIRMTGNMTPLITVCLRASPLSAAILDSLLEVEGVDSASLYVARNYAEGIYYNNTAFNGGKIYGIDHRYFSTCGYQMQKGRGFTDSDYKNFRKVAILDSDAAKSLFSGTDPLNKTIEIKGELFTVVGICQKTNTFKPVINSMEDYMNYMNASSGGILFIPNASWPIIYNYDEPQNLIIRAKVPMK